MTTFNLRTVRLHPGELFQADLPVALEPLDLGGQRYVPEPEEPSARFVMNRAVSGTVFSLELEVALVGPCIRCLQSATVPIRVAAKEYQAESPDSEELEMPYLADDRLDLSAWARDLIVLSLPPKILCREDCAGLCSGCGANLNLEPCTCEPTEADNRFAKLADLFAKADEG